MQRRQYKRHAITTYMVANQNLTELWRECLRLRKPLLIEAEASTKQKLTAVEKAETDIGTAKKVTYRIAILTITVTVTIALSLFLTQGKEKGSTDVLPKKKGFSF